MRLIGWLIAAAVLSTPVYGVVTSLAGFEFVRWFLGLPESGAPLHRDLEGALSMVSVLLVGACVWQVVMELRSRRRPHPVAVLRRAVVSSAALIAGGFLVTRLLTLIGLDQSALTLGPVLGVGVPLLLRLRSAFFRRPAVPAVGDIWWADVPFEEVAESKDRPCLVVEVKDGHAIVLMITSQDKAGRPGYVPIDGEGWSAEDKNSWLKIDRLINIRNTDFRRFVGRCPAQTWAVVEQEVLSGGPVRRDAPASVAPTNAIPAPFIPE